MSLLVVTSLGLLVVTVDAGALAVDRIRVEALRRGLGAHLATYRRAAGVSQPELGQAIGRTRTTVSKIVSQQRIVRHLLEGCCPAGLRQPLSLVDSNMASTIGGYLADMGQLDAAQRYFEHGRRAGHDARNPACAAYAAAWTTFAAFLRGDACIALDAAAAARSLAARTDDARLKALAEQMAAHAYALDDQHGPCMAACERAQGFLARGTAGAPESLAYWVNEGQLDKHRSRFLLLLGKPRQAVEAATSALARYDQTPYVHDYAHCEVQLGKALVLSKEITEAARVLGDAASLARLSPRLTAELHATRALMQPWDGTSAVTTLDAQLEAYGLGPEVPV